MLAHPNIFLMRKTHWQDSKDSVNHVRIDSARPIDKFFKSEHGELLCRSLRFVPETLHKTQYQAAETVNFPNECDYTRITELSHLKG